MQAFDETAEALSARDKKVARKRAPLVSKKRRKKS
jgi:hypothetical protein